MTLLVALLGVTRPLIHRGLAHLLPQIIGFAGTGVSSIGVPGPFDMGVSAGVVDSRVFALCLRDTYGVAYLGSQPGVTDSPRILWTRRANTSDYYTVELEVGL